MDYGKLAYLKASDIEALVSKIRQDDKGISCVTKQDVYGETAIGTCYNGVVIAFASESVDYYVGNVKVFSGSGFAAFKADGDVTVGGTAQKLTVVMFNGSLIDGGCMLYADHDDEKSQVAYIIKDTELCLYLSADYNFNPSVAAYIEGKQADVTCYDGEFVVVSANENYIKVMGLTSGLCRRFPYQADKVAAVGGKTLTVAYLKNGKVKYFALDAIDGNPSEEKSVELSGVSDVRAIKGGDGFVICAGGVCYVKRLAETNECKDNICVYTDAEVTYE